MFGFNAFSEFPFSDILFGDVPPNPLLDKHDGWTKKEKKKWKELQKKLALAEAQKIQAKLDKRQARKQFIRELVSPVAKKQQTEVELSVAKEVQVGKPPIDLVKVNADIAHLEQKQKLLLEAIELRKQIAYKQAQLAILEAKAKAQEDDDEAAILAILFQTHI